MSYLKNSISILIPTGGIVAYTGVIDSTNNIPPTFGWLLCDGAAYSRTTYSALFGVIGTDYGVGNGTTTFNVPNFQAAFLRGAGSQTYPTGVQGTTYGTTARTINTPQGTALQTHAHTATAAVHNHSVTENNHIHAISYTPSNSHSHTNLSGLLSQLIYTYDNTTGGYNTQLPSSEARRKDSNTYGGNTSGAKINNQSSNNLNVTIGYTTNTNISINNSTTNANPNESIPFNYAINWIIKY